MMFTTPNFDYTGKLIWAWGSYIALTLTYTFISIPYVSLIGVITNDPKERLSANSYRFVMTKIAMFLVTIIVPMAALYFGKKLGQRLPAGDGLHGDCVDAVVYLLFLQRKRAHYA